MDFSWSGQSQGQLWLVLCFAPVNDFSVSGSSPSDSRHNPITKKYIQTHSSWTLAFQWKTEYNFYCCRPPLARMECSYSVVPCSHMSQTSDQIWWEMLITITWWSSVILGDPGDPWWSGYRIRKADQQETWLSRCRAGVVQREARTIYGITWPIRGKLNTNICTENMENMWDWSSPPSSVRLQNTCYSAQQRRKTRPLHWLLKGYLFSGMIEQNILIFGQQIDLLQFRMFSY